MSTNLETDQVSVRGTVSASEKDYALAGANVTLSSDSLHLVQFAIETDDNGRYELRNLAPGAYTIPVEADGFRPATRSV